MQHKHAQYTQNSVLTINSIAKNIDRGFSLLQCSSKNAITDVAYERYIHTDLKKNT